MAVDSRNALLAELTSRTSAPVVTGVVAALGALVETGVDPATVCPPVNGYFVDYGEDVLAVTAISAQRLIRYEMTREGSALTWCVPLSRVRRVAEANENSTVTVLVEFDADRSLLRLEGASAMIDGDGEPRAIRLEGDVRFGGIVLTGDSDQASTLSEFAMALRVALAS